MATSPLRAVDAEQQTPRRPLLTLRVSRDSGRTWGPLQTIRADVARHPDISSRWPPCQCPRHRDQSNDRIAGILARALLAPPRPAPIEGPER